MFSVQPQMKTMLAAAAVAAGLAGCGGGGSTTIIQKAPVPVDQPSGVSITPQIVKQLNPKLGGGITTASCPNDIPPKVGRKFSCTLQAGSAHYDVSGEVVDTAGTIRITDFRQVPGG